MALYWHDHNPWRDEIVYITVDQALACYHGLGDPVATQTGLIVDTPDTVRARWERGGRPVDCYLLPGPTYVSLGIRHGPRPENYFSPLCKQETARIILKMLEDT